MNSKLKFQRLTVIFLSLILISVTISACSGNKNTGKQSASPSDSQASSASASGESSQPAEPPVKMSIFMMEPFEGVATDPVAQEIEKRTGVQLEFMKLSDDQFKVLMASGDLPELVLVKRDQLKSLIQGNSLMELDPLLESNAPGIAGMKERVNFSKKFLSDGTGKLFVLPTMAGPTPRNYTYDIGPELRWEYYKELGYPAISSSDDLLNVVSEMLKKHPKTDDGKKMYGFSLWYDWGMTWPIKVLHSYGLGYEQLGTKEYDMDHNFRDFILDENSSWWQAVAFYNKAQRKGLLDPESFTQKYDNMLAKGNNGQVLATYAQWTTQFNDKMREKGKTTSGFMPIPGAFPYIYLGGSSNNGMPDRLLGITQNNKHPDKAMKLIDFLFSPEGSRLIWSGVEGKDWVAEGGNPHLSDSVIESYGTTDMKDKAGITRYNKLAGYAQMAIHPGDNAPMDLSLVPAVFQKRLNDIDKEYIAHYGVEYPGQVFEKLRESGNLKFLDINTDLQIATATEPDDMKRVDEKVMDYLNKNIFKVILAKNDDEYATLRNQLVEDLKKLGLDKLSDYWTNAINQAKSDLQSVK
ncbi:extracellular solute-binding protein [Cohnella silvisoli]|uniref:Extracellular solute-binding protein n=1 Tax=Cohnella silvisoli TaxID=2873699 RepID=A0ABV1KLM9_9BACL|nr:extracellular solute-binding protein [Cohnella silvisoli]MCD9020645.1 extracellular solute-binding protein [Cohnella silvisoli]